MNKFLSTYLIFILGIFTYSAQAQTQSEIKNAYWWPQQKLSKEIVRCKRPANLEEQMLAQSVAGLVARAVNNGKSNEMIWVEISAPQYKEWYKDLVKQHNLKETGVKSVWDLANKYKKKGIIKGFILYSKKDNSVNTATVYAGLKDGILVEESLLQKAIDNGFNMLIDARQTNLETCFKEEKNKLNKNLLVVVNPALSNNRDLAIAHKSMVYYGVDSFYNSILEWMQPISPIIGWNEGPESEHISPPSEYGHINTASDYSFNMTALSAASLNVKIPKAKSIDPKKDIDFETKNNYHAFVLSDGDNMQWTMNAFFNEEYYANPAKKEVPTSWTSCPVNVSMMSPYTWSKIVNEQSNNSSIVEFSGGYQYPDIFGLKRSDRWQVLREYVRKTNVHMKRTGVKVLNIMIRNSVLSDDARKAFQIYAEEIEDLTGIIAIQYSPYHGGEGKVIWVKNKKGIEIPVVTAKYSLWGKINNPGFGRPDQIAKWIDEDASEDTPSINWTMVHAWSRYTKDKNGTIVDAPNNDATAVRGMTPIKWCIDNLKSNTKVITIEELLWRIRMKNNPEQTKSIINK